jgi:hypothetical protein
MKKLLLLLFLILSTLSYSQTVIQYDFMETSSPLYLTGGWWTPAATATWATNTSVSPTQSAVIYGLGNASSIIEQDWYSLPNVTGLIPTRIYQLKFRLSSQTFTSTSATKGVDVADYISVQVSRNGGITYVTELRIIGNNNSIWPYTSSGVINHTANGTFTNSAAPTGDIYQSPAGSTTTGPSTITLTMPTGITQLAIDIYCRVNSAGEEWWIDNIQLIEINPLPVELLYFKGNAISTTNHLYWSTASELNSDYFLIEKSFDGIDWDLVGSVNASGNSSQTVNYSLTDNDVRFGISYYRLKQFDFDGVYRTYEPISINNIFKEKNILKITNLLGQEVDEYHKGLLIIIYDDGTIKRVVK